METFSTKKRKLNYTIHNPNTVEGTANYLLNVLIEASMGKVEAALREATDRVADFGNEIQEERLT